MLHWDAVHCITAGRVLQPDSVRLCCSIFCPVHCTHLSCSPPPLLPPPDLPQVVSDPALDKSGVYWSWDNEKSSLWFDQVDGALENNVSKEVSPQGGGKKQGRGVAGLAWAGLGWAAGL